MIKVINNSKNLILICLLMLSSLAFSQGSRYTGSYKKSAPLVYKNQKNIVIEGLEFSSANGRTITLWNCENVIIRNCKFTDVDMKVAIYAERGSNILVTDNTFENVHGAFIATGCDGNIRFEHNDVKNVLGTLRGGVVFSNAAHLNNCTGPGNSISYNAIENIPGKGSPEDNIALYRSHGTPESPIMIKGNWIRGGGRTGSGGGINLGDWGGSYQIAEDNILVNPGQVGMGMAGGHNLKIRNNKIFSAKQPNSNVGLALVNWTSDKTGASHNITVENNEVNWTNKEGKQNLWWIYPNVEPIKGKDTNKYNKDLNESILPKVIIGRAKNTDDNTPPVTPPDNNTPETPITHVYIDSYNRIAIKYLVPSIPAVAHAEGYSSNGKLLIAMKLPRYNQAFPISVPKGDYYVKITYPELEKTEITKVTID